MFVAESGSVTDTSRASSARAPADVMRRTVLPTDAVTLRPIAFSSAVRARAFKGASKAPASISRRPALRRKRRQDDERRQELDDAPDHATGRRTVNDKGVLGLGRWQGVESDNILLAKSNLLAANVSHAVLRLQTLIPSCGLIRRRGQSVKLPARPKVSCSRPVPRTFVGKATVRMVPCSCRAVSAPHCAAASRQRHFGPSVIEIRPKKGNAMTELSIGSPAPDFSLPRDGGATVSLADFSGKRLVLYFYPKDDTSAARSRPRRFPNMRGLQGSRRRYSRRLARPGEEPR